MFFKNVLSSEADNLKNSFISKTIWGSNQSGKSHVHACDLFYELKILFHITYMSWLKSLHVVWKKIYKIKDLLLSETRNEVDR